MAVMILILLILYLILSQYVWIDALENFIFENGLSALTCTCNVISKCIPNRRPILIIRHYVWDNSTKWLFQRLRDGIGTYPMIIEATDFRWELISAVIESKEYFIPYHLEDMTFEEGKMQLVDRYHIWSMAEYDKVYNTTGGHIGSLRLLFDYHKVLNMTLDEAISHMKERAYNQIVVALNGLNRADELLRMLVNMGSFEMIKFMEDPELLPEVVTLSNMNIIFVKGAGGKVFPQNELMKWGILKILLKKLKA